MVASIQRVIDADAADTLWEELGIGEAIRTRMERAELTAPHEWALFAMAAQRLDDPGSKPGCASRWLPDIGWLPEAGKLAVDHLHRALDFLAVWPEEIERDGNQVAARFGVQEARADHGNNRNRSRIGWQEVFPDFRRVRV